VSESRTRKVTMTVYKIEADLVDMTQFGDLPEARFAHGPITVYAEGRGDRHEWRLGTNERAWIGDTVEVSIIEPAPSHPTSTPLKVPPKDLR